MVDSVCHQVRADVTLLQALQQLSLAPPALCHHSGLGNRGSCGLCAVSVKLDACWQLKLACQLEVVPGLQVRTNASQAVTARAVAARLLLRHAPFRNQQCEGWLRAIADLQHQEKKTISEKSAVSGATLDRIGALPKGCVLCGLCVSVCRSLGHNRLILLGRGTHSRISFITEEEEKHCASCRACQRICPTGYILDLPAKVFSQGLYS